MIEKCKSRECILTLSHFLAEVVYILPPSYKANQY